MSSFPGRMKEYPAISLDRFDRENLHAKAYFLSHCHKDHMKGLKGPLLKRKLKFSLTVKLYCSFVTKELLLNNPKYAFWEDHIVPLELDSPSRISLTDETSGETEDVVVTLLTAGHCPGSVMFLFEGSQGTVLYTGDFRLAVGDAARMEGLHSGDRVKDIRSVYIDSTFFDPKYHQIPTREACLAGIRQLVQDWICRSPYHVVWLNCKAAYGYEYLFTNLGLEFSSQIHVNSLEMFKKMPDILCHMTSNRATQIHACRHPKDEELFRANRLPCGSMAPDGVPLNIISIKPSTIWFGERTRKTSVIAKMGGSSYRACFSFHSSYTEVKDFLSYINPVYIYPNVIPLGKTLEDVTELLKPFCRNHGDDREMIYKPLGTLVCRSRKRCASEGSDSDDLFDEISTTPRRHKMLVNATNDVVSGQPAQTKAQSKDSDVEETNQLLELRPLAQISNYTDCTESNDDDEEDEDDDLNLLPAATPFTTSNSDPFQTKSAPPCWDRFFKTEPAITDESEIENSQTLSSANTGSQSPFREDEDNCSVQNSSQSTHISDAGSENLTDTILFQQRDCTSVGCDQMMTDLIQDETTKAGLMVSALSGCSDEPEEPKSDSQISSDFELPPTPGSKIPHPEDLRVLYRKLAAGEELISGDVC